MKKILVFSVLLSLLFSACSTVKVVSDYDKEVDFNQFTSFAFYKPGIDKAKISDLDKKRILRAIEKELTAKGMVKSNNPTLLVSIFTKENERLHIYNNHFGWGWGWNPWWYGGPSYVSSSTEGTLYIDFIDKTNQSLVWQGKGTATLNTSNNVEKKEERIALIVSEILSKYPPGSEK